MHKDSERGQAMAEYAILLGIISIALLTTLGVLGVRVAGLYDAAVRMFTA